MNKLLYAPRYLIPLLVFIILAFFLWRGLTLNPRELPSALLNKSAPVFELPDLMQPQQILTHQIFLGHVSLLNVWSTWCVTCHAEHAFLMELAHTQAVTIYGLDYKDDSAAARQWLAQYGNPYKAIAVDKAGQAAINWGVYGTPETFIIDKKGIIRYKVIGALTPTIWQNQLAPLIQQLQN